MARYQAFLFEEGLTPNGLRGLHDSLRIGEKYPSILVVMRMLSGSIKLTHTYTRTIINSRKNYFTEDFKSYGQNWGKDFPKLVGEDLSSDDIGEFIHFNGRTNEEFYRNILYDISHFQYASKKEQHTTAFIFIYRLLEKISYAFPLIYAAKTQDFLHTFDDLKNLMTSDDEKKELGFFKKFVEKLYEGNAITDTSVDIEFLASGNEIVQKQMYKLVSGLLKANIIHSNSVEPDKLSINYCDMGSFIVTVRNRFFHNMNGRAGNIRSENLADVDLLFEAINDKALQWIATVLLGVFSHSVTEYLKIKRSI